jgi:hypothetical protein
VREPVSQEPDAAVEHHESEVEDHWKVRAIETGTQCPDAHGDALIACRGRYRASIGTFEQRNSGVEFEKGACSEAEAIERHYAACRVGGMLRLSTNEVKNELYRTAI